MTKITTTGLEGKGLDDARAAAMTKRNRLSKRCLLAKSECWSEIRQ